MPVIETEGLSKRYGGSRGIEDVSFSVEAAEVFGFLGPNGAGKTTTIRTLLDFLHPTSGSARIFGLDSRRDSVAIRARLGNLPGDFGYGKQASGREALHLLARLRGIDGLGRAEALAERFGVVFAPVSRPTRPMALSVFAFGVRHHPRKQNAETFYEVDSRRTCRTSWTGCSMASSRRAPSATP